MQELATTNRVLREEIKKGWFREDLFYRLNVLPRQLLSLRERPSHILPLAQQLISRYCRQAKRLAPEFDKSAIKALLAHHWQSTVRELDNVLQRAFILQPGESITWQDLAFESMNLEFNNSQNTDDSSIESSLNDDLRSHEEHYIIEAFENNNGVRCCIANELGISERTLRYKLLRFREEGVAIPEKVGKKSA